LELGKGDFLVTDTYSKKSFPEHLALLRRRLGNDAAYGEAVGGDFEAVGKLEYYLLRSLGLSDGHFIVDVGCGSGRLACQLAPYKGIRYCGVDVVPELLEHARRLTNRVDWVFVSTDGMVIPCDDESADYVVFFSVFTHLLHEDTYRYFVEASRSLKKQGQMVFSFLEFRIPCHWDTFISSVQHTVPGRHLNQFMDRDAIRIWAKQSGFSEPVIYDGDKGHIPIPEEIRWANGSRMGTLGNLGQSVAVLTKL